MLILDSIILNYAVLWGCRAVDVSFLHNFHIKLCNFCFMDKQTNAFLNFSSGKTHIEKNYNFTLEWKTKLIVELVFPRI